MKDKFYKNFCEQLDRLDKEINQYENWLKSSEGDSEIISREEK